MADQLDFAKALSFARQLKAIPNFPWDEDVITSHAHHLMRWCKGAILENGRIWPAEAQAHWLVTEAQENWDKWLGTGELLKLFRRRFVPDLPPANSFESLGEKPPIDCSSCNDFGIVNTPQGYRYCDCAQGSRMAADPDLGEGWLRLHNGNRLDPAAVKQRAADERAERQREEAQFFATVARVNDARSTAEAVLNDPTATNEQKQLAQEALRIFEGKGKPRKSEKKSERPRYLR